LSIPQTGELKQIAANVFWLRSPMPFSLDHINLWLIEEEDSWVVIDTGMNLKASKQLWLDVVSSHLKDKPISKVICTHMHPDHLGLAGWLCDEYGATLLMSQGEYQAYTAINRTISENNYAREFDFFTRGGLTEQQLQSYDKFIKIFQIYVSPMVNDYHRLQANDLLSLGGYEWQVVIGRGHSPEHVCLWCPSLNIFISGDQLLPTISSNVSVHSDEPEADPLSYWINSYYTMLELLNANSLILPAHGKPFSGADIRIHKQLADIETNLDKLLEFCTEPRCVTDTFAVLFKSKIDAANLFMAFGEAQAHLNCLVARGKITKVNNDQPLVTYLCR
jgi:glyoxylase-like metal-dependent hydrolase (beta-lactamase superfamily II)